MGPLAVDPGELIAARSQMAFTLGFHIILACLGVGLPTLVLIANGIGLSRRDPIALLLARRWSLVMAVTFAVGAVTGTVLSFEMGLLWPVLMGRFGGAFGIPFAIEGLFFFLEAIFIAIYIYGWDRLSPRAHLLSGIPVALAGLGGTFSVIAANSWMNQPAGFVLGPDGRVAAVDTLAVIFNGATWYEVPHMFLAAYLVTGFLLASVYAVGLLRGHRDRYVRLGFAIPFVVAAIAAPMQVAVGDFAARAVFEDQPAKFAAMELITRSGPNQPVTIGGALVGDQVIGGLAIPNLGSILAGFSPDTRITGFDEIPIDQRPPATLVHLAWDAMVGIGSALVILGLWGLVLRLRHRDHATARWFLRGAALAGIGAIVALESGWIVTEVGRQPWVVYLVLRTADAVSQSGGIRVTFATVIGLYAVLGIATLVILRTMSRRWAAADLGAGGRDTAELLDGGDGEHVPYGPRGDR
ncbi:MAG: cytochrome ubiquinol oxidase subunit I [Deltaproteobacteria bacterium]|nr:MAG: cytochrome ubiquinol oxidase subunit I [Deltaproteobacteria bacterium]